jgi:membrane associated rhomboid family serine protease
MPPLPPVTKALLLILTAVFFGEDLLARMQIVSLGQWFALWPLQSGQFLPWQVLSYAFLHGDMTHLFFNALGLWMFGAELERLWGHKRYLQMLVAGALAAALAQLLFAMLVGLRAPTVGASGALFALLLSYGMLFPNRVIMPLLPPIPMKARTYVAVFGGLELVFGLMGRDGIAHFAHLGGMLGAFLLIRYWRRQTPFGWRRR